MLDGYAMGSVVLAAALTVTLAGAHAFDDAEYPTWKGQWTRFAGSGQWDPTKPPGRGRKAPLTDEYQAILEAGLADQRVRDQGINATPTSRPRT